MVTKNSARAFLTNSTCEGQVIHLGALNNSYLYFKDGEVWTHVSAWNQALLVLDGSVVDWNLGEFKYQKRNIAHDRARLYAINSHLVQPPEAMGSALVSFVRLGKSTARELQAAARTPTPVEGSAWIVKGPDSRSPPALDSRVAPPGRAELDRDRPGKRRKARRAARHDPSDVPLVAGGIRSAPVDRGKRRRSRHALSDVGVPRGEEADREMN